MAFMDEDLKAYLAEMRGDVMGRIDRAAQSFAVDLGHVHSEIRAVLDRVKKVDSNVTTCLELLVRQSRWHDETDTKAVELLVRVNELERRLNDLAGGQAKE